MYSPGLINRLIKQIEQIICCRNMRSNNYATVEAHILRCRLHHQNNLSYSVGLKSGKDQLTSTHSKSATNLIIEMDAHLSLQVDKHSYQHFPKLTLVVNVMGEHKELRTVGNTFANYRKQGVQTFQISECSCKDKAFEVDIAFSVKINEAKNSNSKSNKKQISKPGKGAFYSHQPTPRESREAKAQMQLKLPKQFQKPESPKKQTRLTHVKSQKIVSRVSEKAIAPKQRKDNCQLLKSQIAVLNQKIKLNQLEIRQLRQASKAVQNEKVHSQLWHQLLILEEEKNSIAMGHIIALEDIILGIMPKGKAIGNTTSTEGFKIIEEEDEIILMNEELQAELEKERKQNQQLSQQIQKLRSQIEDILNKQNARQEEVEKTKEQPVDSGIKEMQLLSSYLETPNQMMITSRQKEKVDVDGKTYFLRKEVQHLEAKYDLLKQEINKLEIAKKGLEESSQPVVKKKSSPAVPKRPPPREANLPKKPTSGSKQKSVRPEPLKTQRKTTIPSSQGTANNSTAKQGNKSNTSMGGKNAKLSTELETKTEGDKSFGNLSSSIGINEIKSETPIKIVNEANYMANTFEGSIKDFES